MSKNNGGNDNNGDLFETSGTSPPNVPTQVAKEIKALVRRARAAGDAEQAARVLQKDKFRVGARAWIRAGILWEPYEGVEGAKEEVGFTDKQAQLAVAYRRAWEVAGKPGTPENPHVPADWRDTKHVQRLGRSDRKPITGRERAKVPPQGGDAFAAVGQIALRALAAARDPNLVAGKLMDEIMSCLPDRPKRVVTAPTPCEWTPRVSLLLGDVRSTVSALADGSLSLAVTSPPYWGMRDFGGGKLQMGREKTWQEHIQNLLAVFALIKRKMNKRGVLFLNYNEPRNCAAGHLLGLPEELVRGLIDQGWYKRETITWEKTSRSPGGGGIQRTSEPIYLFTVSPDTALDWSHEIHHTGLAKDSLKEHLRDVKKGGPQSKRARSSGRLDEGCRPTTVWRISSETHVEHEAPYPVELAERCVLAGSRPGDLVLDPFVGSGTTAIAAIKHGRSVVGIDLVKKNIKLSKQRLATVGVNYELVEALDNHEQDSQAITAETQIDAQSTTSPVESTGVNRSSFDDGAHTPHIIRDWSIGLKGMEHRLVQADFRNALATVPAASLPFVWGSPPWWDVDPAKYDGSFDMPTNIEEWLEIYAADASRLLHRVIPDGGVFAMNIADVRGSDGGLQGVPERYRQAFLAAARWTSHCDVILNKLNGKLLRCDFPQAAHEQVLLFSKGTPATFNPHGAMLPPSESTVATRQRRRALGRGVLPDDAPVAIRTVWPALNPSSWDGKGDHKYTHHPSIPEMAIRTWTKPGDPVADIWCGTGSTLVAALRNGRRAIGIDVSANYLARAEQNLIAEAEGRMRWKSCDQVIATARKTAADDEK